MIEIPLTQGKVALIDDADLPLVSGRRWRVLKAPQGFYAIGGWGKKSLSMHRLLLGFPAGMEVDHIDGNGLNNQRSNLRLATHSQNMANSRARRTSKTGVKGVRVASSGRYEAACCVRGKYHHLGTFDTVAEASAAYLAAARVFHGEFANPGTSP